MLSKLKKIVRAVFEIFQKSLKVPNSSSTKFQFLSTKSQFFIYKICCEAIKNEIVFASLGMPYNITKVRVQGAKDANEWPYKFCLSYSLDGSSFKDVKGQESSCLVSYHST